MNTKVVVVGRAVSHVPVWFEVLQVKRAQVYGSQGHSGHSIFPNVIRLMASGKIDMTRIVTARFPLERVLDAMNIASENKHKHAKILIKPE